MSISAIIIARNEAGMLPGCLKRLAWVDEMIVVDAESTDRTPEIARRYGAKVVTVRAETDYASSRNYGKRAARGEWLLYIDADERVSRKLREEIKRATREIKNVSYKIPRRNFILGTWVRHGGFWPDYCHRLFEKNALVKWTGKLHESPTIKGEVLRLETPLDHHTGRSISASLKKSARWADIEAQLLYEAHAPRVSWWRVLKVFAFKLFQVLFGRLGILDGVRGLAVAYIQALHDASVLVTLWQRQQRQ